MSSWKGDAPPPGLEPLRGLIAGLRGELPAEEDWESIIALANRTLCTPTLAVKLEAAGLSPALPDDVHAFLGEIRARNERRNAQMLGQLAEAAACLEVDGITPVLLKGTAWLATAGSTEIAARVLADLDLMVAPEAFDAAVARLTSIGYRLREPANDPRVPAVMWRAQDAGTIDLHTEIGGMCMQLGFADLASGAEVVPSLGGRVLVPSGTLQVAVLVLHDQLKDRDYLRGRINLRHLLDIQALSASFEESDWEELQARFPRGYARNGLRTHLLTAHRLLGLRIPDRLLQGLLPALQFQRRMAQARWPAAFMPLTLLSLLDPFYLRARRAWARAEGTRELRPRRQNVERLLFAREHGKI